MLSDRIFPADFPVLLKASVLFLLWLLMGEKTPQSAEWQLFLLIDFVPRKPPPCVTSGFSEVVASHAPYRYTKAAPLRSKWQGEGSGMCHPGYCLKPVYEGYQDGPSAPACHPKCRPCAPGLVAALLQTGSETAGPRAGFPRPPLPLVPTRAKLRPVPLRVAAHVFSF